MKGFGGESRRNRALVIAVVGVFVLGTLFYVFDKSPPPSESGGGVWDSINGRKSKAPSSLYNIPLRDGRGDIINTREELRGKVLCLMCKLAFLVLFFTLTNLC
eukprot:m.82975 g.82975  ORF g.82975 m.82975 type:complete len:103 (+) comp12107_c0_seq5:1672-1980(+)